MVKKKLMTQLAQIPNDQPTSDQPRPQEAHFGPLPEDTPSLTSGSSPQSIVSVPSDTIAKVSHFI